MELKKRGKIYFANYDIKLMRPTTTGLDLELLSKEWKKSKAKNIILMADCCYSGGLIKKGKNLAQNNKNVLCLTSATASNISTANWTFSQTILDCFRGDAIADRDENNLVTVTELNKELLDAMKFRERQMNGFFKHGYKGNDIIAKVTQPIDRTAKTGSYQWAKHNNKWKPVRVLKHNNEENLCEFYFYSDKVRKQMPKTLLRPMHFVKHKKNSSVQVEWKKKWYKATVLKTVDDFAYIKYNNYDDSLERVGSIR